MEGVDYHETFTLVEKLVTFDPYWLLQLKEAGQSISWMSTMHSSMVTWIYMKIPQGFAKKREKPKFASYKSPFMVWNRLLEIGIKKLP